jgi:NAD(P)-dependent dehydrogenase (short-subunit alcohol dehydrogenase family)
MVQAAGSPSNPLKPTLPPAPDLRRRLEGRVVLVTGAARGIGLATARRCRLEGAIVVLTDVNDAAVHAAAAGLAEEAGPLVRCRQLDVREESAWREVVDRVVAEDGRLDVLVNNAGITGFSDDVASGGHAEPLGPQDPEHASLRAWHEVHRTNLDGVFLGCREAIRVMKPPASGGALVNISSRSGLVGIPRAVAYAASKAAVRNHTKSVALYCAEMGYGIRCNSIHPGAVLTPMWEPMLGTGSEREAAIAELAREVPIGRMGAPEDVAAMVAFLASDDALYVTGAEFVLDGGILAGAAATPRS